MFWEGMTPWQLCSPLSPDAQGSCLWPPDVLGGLGLWQPPLRAAGSPHGLEERAHSRSPPRLGPSVPLQEPRIDLKTNLLLRASIDVRHLSFLLHLMSFQGTAASSRRLPSKDLGFHQNPRAPQRSALLTSHMSLMNSTQSTSYNFLQTSFPYCLSFFPECLEHRG